MKKKLLWFILTVVISLCALGLTACEDSEEDLTLPQQLAVPTVMLQDDTASWGGNDKASRFEVSLNGSLSYVENSVTSIQLNDGQTLKVRAIGDGVKYLDSDWSNAVTYTAPVIVEKYTVIWKNGDAILETDVDVDKGTLPIYDGITPTKEKDAQYSYSFSGWSPEVSAVTSDITYYAQFASTLNKYTVVWKNGEDILETDTDVDYGTTPTYNGQEPSKTSTAQYSYIFDGWSPTVDIVTGDITYSAKFQERAKNYVVTFYNETGTTILDSVVVNYGENAEYTKSVPVKNATESHAYIFDKWVTTQGGNVGDDLSCVTSDRTVYASFREFARTVSVYVVSNNLSYGTVSVATLNNIPYGSLITVDGNTVAVNGQIITALANTQTAQYTYIFDSWTTEATVGSDTVITANFSRSINKYTVTWKNGDTVLEVDENVRYGTTSVYNGQTPEKPSDNENIYIFSGWSPTISTVVGDITYVAQFTSRVNNHVVIFYDEDGTLEFGRDVVGYGETAIYSNALPTKEATDQYSYTFDKWVTAVGGTTEANLTNITADTSVYAKFVQTLREYNVVFCDYDGTVLSTINVEYGCSAVAPEVVLGRDGYRFDGWDKSLENITSDVTITAKYVKQYKVEFIDYDGTIICSEEVDEGDDFINLPENPTRTYYEFIGWDITDFTNIYENIVANAVYIRTYKVEFVDYNGTIIKKETIRFGESATAPESPTRIEYDFTGWDKDFSLITSDLTVKAQYKIKRYDVQFIDANGKVLKTEQVRHGFNATPPEVAETYFNWSTLKGYRFTGWSTSANNITSSITITALYEEEITQPIIVVRDTTVATGATTTQLDVYISCSSEFYGISLDMSFDNELIQLGKQVTTISVTQRFGVEAIEGDGNYTSNLKDDCTYEFRWTSGDGIQPNGSPIPILTFNLSLSEFQQEGEYLANILEGTYIIDNNLTKVNPVIISGKVIVKTEA